MRKNISRRMFAAQSGAAVFGLSAINGIAAKQAKPLSDKLLANMPKLLEWAGVPGVQVAVVEKERVVWKSEFGVMNAETKEAVSAETVFPAASLSKPVFAYAMLKLS
jgi:CubicO group peptidase (beta-lactamase class C family)